MESSAVKILSTKKLADKHLISLNEGFELTHFDIIEVVKIDTDLEKLSENIIFTSFKAAQIGLEHLAENAISKNYYCVGGKTEALLNMLGLNIVKCASYSKDLASFIIDSYDKQSFSYLCNENRLDELPDMLAEANVDLKEFVTYRSEIIDFSDIEFKESNVYMWFSPMGVSAMAKQLVKLDQWHVAIGATTAEALRKENIESDKILFPAVPSVDGMIDLINNYIK